MKTKLSIILLASLMSLNVFSISTNILNLAQKLESENRSASWGTIRSEEKNALNAGSGFGSYLYRAASYPFNYFSGDATQIYGNASKKVSDRGSEVRTITISKLEETKKLTRKKFDERLDQKIDKAADGTVQCIFGFFDKLTNILVGEQPNAKDEKAKNPKTVKNTSEANDQTLTNKINEDTGDNSSILGIALLSPLSGIIYFALKYYK